MVPRKLSENLCSLGGGVDRRTFSVVVKLDEAGRLIDDSPCGWPARPIQKVRRGRPAGAGRNRRSDAGEDVSAALGAMCEPELQVAGMRRPWLGRSASCMRSRRRCGQRLSNARRRSSCRAMIATATACSAWIAKTGRSSCGRDGRRGACAAGRRLRRLVDPGEWTGEESHQLVEEFMLLANRLWRPSRRRSRRWAAAPCCAAAAAVGGAAQVLVRNLRGEWHRVQRRGPRRQELDSTTVPQVVCDCWRSCRARWGARWRRRPRWPMRCSGCDVDERRRQVHLH